MVLDFKKVRWNIKSVIIWSNLQNSQIRQVAEAVFFYVVYVIVTNVPEKRGLLVTDIFEQRSNELGKVWST